MKRGRGRAAGFVMSEEHRTKIANSQILKYLIEHAEGRREMSQTQVTAGISLLKKVLPDLASIEYNGTLTLKRASEMVDDELASIAASGGEGIAAQEIDPPVTH